MNTRTDFLLAIAAARAEGFTHYAEALRQLCEMEYPQADQSPTQRRQARKDSFHPFERVGETPHRD